MTRDHRGYGILLLAVVLYAAIFVTLLFPAEAAQDMAKIKEGKEIFERRCTGCHLLDEVRVGPALRGVFGRIAGSSAGFPYSDGLKGSHIRWDENTLDHWLTDTESVAPGNDMSFRVPSAQERGSIIAYLKSLSSK